MSVELVKKELRRFIAAPEPAVLCIEGRWGTGKTFAWEQAVREAARTNTMGLKGYAYISLFGIKDPSDILQTAFVNQTPASLIVSSNDETKSESDKAQSLIDRLNPSQLWRDFKSLGGLAAEHTNVPYINGLGGVARALISKLVGKTLICIDDLERKGSGVTINEIMGVISQLRDDRDCKVVLILNENSLDKDELEEFRRYSEKVIDATFRFSSTPEESAMIAFRGSDDLTKTLRAGCIQLQITNIRVLNKIRSYATRLSPLIADLDAEFKIAILRSLIVIAWSMVSPQGEGSPNLSYLTEKRRKQYFALGNEQYTPEEQAWGDLLTRYGFTECDSVDRALIEGIKNGFFNEEEIATRLKPYIKDAKIARANAALEAAWRPLHASFNDNEDAVANSICQGCLANIEYLTPVSLDGAVSTLKTIGYPEKAKMVLDAFMKAFEGDDRLKDVRRAFDSNLSDPEVEAIFAAMANASKSSPSPLKAATRIYNGGWAEEDEEVLFNLSIDDLVKLFQTANESDRSTLIFGSLEFRKMRHSSERQKQIVQKATEALVQIGRQSPLNALRVSAYGIHISASVSTLAPHG
jgi:hypothetical protein